MMTPSILSLALVLLSLSDLVDATSKRDRKGRLRITNITYQQPFSGFIFLVHNRRAQRLFELGGPSSSELQELAENGNPGDLLDFYTRGRGKRGILEAKALPGLGQGMSMVVRYTVDAAFPFISLASMFVNSNDGIVAANAAMFTPYNTYFFPGYDAGTEVNNELCSSIPGPACKSTPGNSADGGGEGFVHVHRGVHGVGDLLEQNSDWRNPMMAVRVWRK